ncbi:MAG: 1-acyl-sn-glycerol-3-phosphate acyltransferase [Chloroflexota bacterium]|nr:MAG: 1-acyl-sn-glycerol-3-phosphate acyltransferase [Chloroflexota bacterium]
MVRDIIHWFVTLLFRILAHVEVTGLENVPAKGAAILASNHLGILDAPLVFILVDRKDTTALVAKKHRTNIFLRMLIEGVNGIWINRDEADTRAMRAAFEHLSKGGILGVAPEGTRSPDGKLNYAKTGAAYLAERAKVPVIPAAVTGSHRGIHQILQFHRPRITMRFGKPFMLPPIERHDRDAGLQRATDEIMVRIAAMLPEEVRGVYADHPRLKEYLQEQAASELMATNEAQ